MIHDGVVVVQSAHGFLLRLEQNRRHLQPLRGLHRIDPKGEFNLSLVQAYVKIHSDHAVNLDLV